MNVLIRLFVLVAVLAVAHECARTSRKRAFLNMLSGKYYGPQDKSYKSYKPDIFYNSLLNLNIEDAQRAIAASDHEGIVECPYAQTECDPNYPYRWIDGSCNNLRFSWWGRSFTLYKRLIGPEYEPGGMPRATGKNGYPLENPRTIALKVHYPKDIYIDASNYLAIFGQFVMHDLSKFGSTVDKNGFDVRCKCSNTPNPDCSNFPVPKIDYYNRDKKCFVQVRSRASYPEFNCYTPEREQINEITAWLDLSQTYGNTQEDSDKLRTFKYGHLKWENFEGTQGHFLPTGCPASGYSITKKNFCFQAGDGRVNQYPLLTSMHMLWLREHNRIADELYALNPHWDDELLFQTARTIAIGAYQNMLYWEYLPLIIGRQLHEVFGLNTQGVGGGYFMGYDDYIFPNIANEFSSAASRYGHALTIPYVSQVDNYDYVVKNNSLWNLMFNPILLTYPTAFDGFVKGCALDNSNWMSPHLTDYLSNYLTHDMGPYNPSKGHSLPALNIMRGREHGVRGYNYYRPLAGLKRARTWDELTYIPKKALERLRQVFDHPDDIDLFSGGMSEYPLPDGIVGPTFAYILARGFRDWKYGDRFYFENGHDKNLRFTLEQLDELRKASFARAICDNSAITRITPNPFLLESKYNQQVDCDSLPRMDLSKWKDYGGYQQQSY